MIFLVGNVFFLSEPIEIIKKLGVWLFISRSFGMSLGGPDSSVVAYEETDGGR